MTEVTNRPLVETGAVVRRAADARDSSFVRDLFAESRDDLWLLPADTRDVIVDMQFRAQRRAWQLEFPAARQDIVVVRGVRAGHVLVAEDRTSVHLVDMAIRPGLRGLGIGSTLLGELVALADTGQRRLRVKVWTANHPARRFFLRAGFVVAGELAGYHELVRPALTADRRP